MSASFVLPIDKPAGPTSHDVVAIARRALGTKRIGHTGTLDPFASGLLLLCIESATRLAEYLSGLPKTYHATARFDGRTSTDDATGEFISTSEAWRSFNKEAVLAAFQQQRGRILQTPSSFSAKKVAGQRAYELARRGEAVELAPVAVTVFELRITTIELPLVQFEVDCSSGTYVRAIARDVGAELGTGGYLTELRRTAIGPFDVARAVTMEALSDRRRIADQSIGMLDAVAHLPAVDVNEKEGAALRFGQVIARAAPPGIIAVAHDRDLVAIALSDGEHIRPKKVFPGD
jgi:tRNA pseudouridine55 synthase